ncbi:MAG: hypothetical protein LBH06_04985 [Rikenellaceae bacterium]|jgi:hypothetical protein|nr:hypothetical protein [Rikenellaceae bacterium]
MKFCYFTLAALLLAACKNEKPLTEKFTPPSATEFETLRQNFLDGITQDYTFNLSGEWEMSFTSPKGVAVQATAYDSNGVVVDLGSVQLNYVELFDIGRMALAGRPLVGYNADGNAWPLVTGGEFFMNATLDGAQLTLNVHMEVPTSFTQGVSPDSMLLWAAEEDETVWEQINGREMGQLPGATQVYTVYCEFASNWRNLDWLMNLPGDKTQIRVKVPDGYNADNCSIYASFFGQPNTLGVFDVYFANGNYFTEHTGIAPIGYQMFVIFISATTTGQFVYATKLVTVEPNQYITFTDADLHSASTQQVIDAINNLHN